MKTKTNIEMLKTLKQYNKVAREVKAKKEGFVTSEEFTIYLKGQISLGFGNETYLGVIPTLNISSKKEKNNFIIHVIDILDCSGSMAGPKITAAVKGINFGINELKKDKTNIKYTYTLCTFSNHVFFKYKVDSLKKVKEFDKSASGNTALYDAIGDSITIVKPFVGENEKVLINIYTDGEENSSRRYNVENISNMIKQFSRIGWTFTFIGTAKDVAFAQKNLNFDDSNTLIYDNTEKGLEKAFAVNSVSRTMYATKVESGEDVSKGFYKNIQ